MKQETDQTAAQDWEMTPDFGVTLLTLFAPVSINLPPLGCPAHGTCQLLEAETAPNPHFCNCTASSITTSQNLFGWLSSLRHWSKKLDDVIQDILDRRRLAKSSWDVLFCVTPPNGGYSAPGAGNASTRCLKISEGTTWLCSAQHFCLQPHTRNDHRLLHASEKLLLCDGDHRTNVNKRHRYTAIPKPNYYTNAKNEMNPNQS